MGREIFDLVHRDRIDAILNTYERHPFNTLGPHLIDGQLFVCCFYQEAVKAFLNVHGREKEKPKSYEMTCMDSSGFFGIVLDTDRIPKYSFTLCYQDGNEYTCEDTYAYRYTLPEEELDRFSKGINYEIYKTLGAHKCTIDGQKGVRFAVWAPNAVSVSVVGDFNKWDTRRSVMDFNERYGVYSLFVPGLDNGDIYKYAIKMQGGAVVLKFDPYGTSSEKRPNTASVIYDTSAYKWTDGSYMKQKAAENALNKPVNIYEVHLGSWKKPTEEDGSFYNYRELAVMLADYVVKMGYTHIELLPVMEHPFDGSWGYQVTGYYAPTSRFGTPADFMYFMDYMHKNGIGVILDWVPAHFPKDAFGLAKFDGTCLYEHADKRKGEHPHWGTLIYNLARPEVSNFLIANALYWVEVFHADGIRMDAVASMLYLDYGKDNGQWVPNKYGGRENLDAIEFLKHLNSIMSKRNAGALMIAEESTAWPAVTGKVEENNSLGFTFKWNMGWMNDFLKYMQQDPLFRKGVHGCLTFSMMYAYSEKFILVFSHDEVVHGKRSLVDKMPGEYNNKFANLRTAYGFMFGHPGKKLLFMGQDFAQFREWTEAFSLEWELIDRYEMHKKMHDYCRDLFKLYASRPAMYELDYNLNGFTWMSCQDADRSIVSFVRRDTSGNILLFVCNFTPVAYEDFAQAVPAVGKYKEILNSDAEKYGGTGMLNSKILQSRAVYTDGQDNSIVMKLPPLSTVIFEYRKK